MKKRKIKLKEIIDSISFSNKEEKTINFIDKDVKNLKIKNLIEKKRIIKNKKTQLFLYYGIFYKNRIYLCSDLLNTLLELEV